MCRKSYNLHAAGSVFKCNIFQAPACINIFYVCKVEIQIQFTGGQTRKCDIYFWNTIVRPIQIWRLRVLLRVILALGQWMRDKMAACQTHRCESSSIQRGMVGNVTLVLEHKNNDSINNLCNCIHFLIHKI